MKYFQESISECIWDIKYRYRYKGNVVDKTLNDTWHRVSKAVAKAERPEERSAWQKKFYDILDGFQFLPGGRIIAGANTRHHVTLFNCFVMPIQEDSLAGIFDALKEGALTLQQGGGIGYDFSTLRPEGSLVSKVGGVASGPVSFMRIWDAMCATLVSTGARRGAMMGILRCDHPDIEAFIRAKSNPQELRHFNVSVLVTDAFMQAVKHNQEWELVFPIQYEDEQQAEVVYRRFSGSEKSVPCRIFRRVNARTLWQKILRAAYDYAEPGVLFEDTINRMNNLSYCEWISATNPCGEIPLPPYGACNLGAINLTQFVIRPFTPEVEVDWKRIETTVQVATRFLDDVIDISRYPLKPQKQAAHATRRIGLGLTGLADMLIMMGMRYGSKESLHLVDKVMQMISHTTWRTSIELAEEKGSFPLLQTEKYVCGEFVKQLPDEIRLAIEKQGIRNSHHNTIAPTGTISLFANNISNGLEPVFSAYYDRMVRLEQGELKKFSVSNYALRLWQQHSSTNTLPPAWTEIEILTPEEHLLMQQVVQPYVDNAISKTINLPEHFPFDALSDVYRQAFELGLKGCTIFRPNPITGSVLVASHPEEDVDRCCRI